MATILVYPDLHGKPPRFLPTMVDFALAPGDFCGDNTRPFQFQAIAHWRKTGEKKMWYDLLGRTQAKKEIEHSQAQGRKVLEKLNARGKTFLVPGNGDWTEEKARTEGFEWDVLLQDHFSTLTKGMQNLINCHYKRVDAGSFEIIGYGVNSQYEYPQGDEVKKYSQERLAEKKRFQEHVFSRLDTLFKHATKPVIFLTHNQPFGTRLDKVRNPRSPRDGKHVGSLVARDIIKKHQPLLSVGGHMHENQGKELLGKTLCINSGLGPDRHVVVEVEGEKVQGITFL